jgi:hypothetical protein
VERNTVHIITRRKANWICDFLRRNCLPINVIEEKIDGRTKVTGRWGRRCKQLLNYSKEKKRYWKLKEEALDRTLWRTLFGKCYGPVVRQTTVWMNEWMSYFFSAVAIRPSYLTLNTSQNMNESKVKQMYSAPITPVYIFRLHTVYTHYQFQVLLLLL